MPIKGCVIFVVCLLMVSSFCCGQQYYISTTDIDNFWSAYDKLNTSRSKEDSVAIIQTEYMDRATNHFKEFIRIRKFTAAEYVKIIGRYPKFWSSVRPLTENIKYRKDEIEEILKKFERELPAFKTPDVCFAMDACVRVAPLVVI